MDNIIHYDHSVSEHTLIFASNILKKRKANNEDQVTKGVPDNKDPQSNHDAWTTHRRRTNAENYVNADAKIAIGDHSAHVTKTDFDSTIADRTSC